MIQHAVLLAAGRGTRLGQLGTQLPKCLLPIAGQLLIDRQLDALAHAGISDVTVVAGFMADAVQHHVGKRCRVVVNEAYDTTGSIASLLKAAPNVKGRGFLMQNGDTLYSTELLVRLINAPAENACLVDAERKYRADEFHIELAHGRVHRYSTAISPERSVGESAQLLRVGEADSNAFLNAVETFVMSHGPHGFPNLVYDALIEGGGLWPVFIAGLPWWEIDSAEDLARCEADHKSGELHIAKNDDSKNADADNGYARIARLMKVAQRRSGWLLSTTSPMIRRPIRTGRDMKKGMTGEMSFSALDLAIHGEDFLRLVTEEALAVGMRVFLMWGTLLGCVRNGDFISGDRDIDLGIMASDAVRLPTLRDRLLRRGLKVRLENQHKTSFVHPRHPQLYIDIDVIAPHRDGWAVVNAHADPTRRFIYHFPHRVFESLTPMTMRRTLDVWVPQDAHAFLAHAYGRWQIPATKVDYRYGPLNTEVELVAADQMIACVGLKE